MDKQPLNLLTVVVQRKLGNRVLDAALKAGATGATFFYAQGTGVRQLLGFVGRLALKEDVVSAIIDLNPKKLDKIKQEAEMDEVKSILATLKQTPYSPSFIAGSEMEPTLKKDDKVLELDYAKNESPKRGDIVSYQVHPNENKTYTLRVVGLPGETIEIKKGNIYINGSVIDTSEIPKRRKYSKDSAKKFGQPFHIPKDHYFVLPDNNTVLLDRAYFGPIHREKILSKVIEVYFPRKNKKIF